MPRTTIASDNFNRASLGADWAQLDSGWGSVIIDTNEVRGDASDSTNRGPVARWVGSGTFSNDQFASIRLINVGAGSGASRSIGVIVRASADTGAGRDFYAAYVRANNPNSTILAKMVNGTWTQLASATTTSWADGDLLSLEVEGATLRVCKNGTPIGGIYTVTDSDLTTGRPGIWGMTGASSIRGDDWEAGDVTAAPTQVQPPRTMHQFNLRRA